MSEKIKKEKKELWISLGLLVGYLLGGSVHMLFYDKTWQEAFSNRELVYGLAGIAISIFIIMRLKRRQNTV